MKFSQMLSALVSLTLVAMMLRVGLDLTLAAVADTVKDWRFVFRALVANYIFVPICTLILLMLLHPKPLVAVGFLILSTCPGAPFAPPLTSIARGNVAASVSLMIILAASSAILAPLLLKLLIPYVSLHEAANIDLSKMLTTLFITQLLPLCIGIGLRSRYPLSAASLMKPISLTVNILLGASLLVVVSTQYRTLLGIRSVAVLAMFALLVSCLTIGWLSGGTNAEIRKATALTTSFRNAGVGMVIASGLNDSAVLAAVVAYTLVSTVGTMLTALWWGKHPKSTIGPAKAATLH